MSIHSQHPQPQVTAGSSSLHSAPRAESYICHVAASTPNAPCPQNATHLQSAPPASMTYTFSATPQATPVYHPAPAPGSAPAPGHPYFLKLPWRTGQSQPYYQVVQHPYPHQLQPLVQPLVHPIAQPLVQPPIQALQLAEPKKRKRKSHSTNEEVDFQVSTGPPDKRRKIPLLNLCPEELKLEQARQIALRKAKEARGKTRKELNGQSSSDTSSSTLAGGESELTEEERRTREEKEEARQDAEAKAAEEAIDKQIEQQREIIMHSKVSHILNEIRGQNIPLERFLQELCASRDSSISNQVSRTFGPKSGPEIVEAIVGRRPKVYENWLAERAASMYIKEREKLAKSMRPDQRTAMKAIVSHMKAWGLQEEMESTAPGIWSVLKSLDDIPQPG